MPHVARHTKINGAERGKPIVMIVPRYAPLVVVVYIRGWKLGLGFSPPIPLTHSFPIGERAKCPPPSLLFIV